MSSDATGRNGSSNGRESGPGGAVPGHDRVSILLILEDEQNRRSTRAALQGLAGVEVVGERFAERENGFLVARFTRELLQAGRYLRRSEEPWGHARYAYALMLRGIVVPRQFDTDGVPHGEL
jgi:hypothetical protein